jgi:acetate kinase
MIQSASKRASSLVTVNAGSSSLRIAGYRLDSGSTRTGHVHLSPAPAGNPGVLSDFVRGHNIPQPDIVMHRVVHGGSRLRAPCLIDAQVEAEIRRLQTLAPLHNGIALDWMEAAREAFGSDVLQAACFDTGFYANLPPAAATYALPREMCKQHEIQRYGFHGLAHQSMLSIWQEQSHGPSDNGRVISLQLGAGCSVTASENSQPFDTSMGFSPLEGLMMATRCGDLDPTVVLHLLNEGGYSAAELGSILNASSGLLAVSGQTGNMQTLLRTDTKEADLAISMFCSRVRKYVGAYLAILGGADAILFGGGIGEHAPAIRARVLERFEWAGVHLDAERNASVNPTTGGPIHSRQSVVELWVTPTDEEAVMVNASRTLLAERAPSVSSSTLEKRP